jgi:hypothetical protein
LAIAAIKQFSGNKRVRENMRRDAFLAVAIAKGGRAIPKAGLPTHPLMLQQPSGGKWVFDPDSLGPKWFTWECTMLAAGACPGR